MSLLSVTGFNSLEDLFVHHLKKMYDSENRLVEALPKMAAAANSVELKSAFLEHLDQTRGHVSRLDKLFGGLSLKPERETCQTMKSLVSEGSDIIDSKGSNPAVRDAALIAAAQCVEHHEMATYGSARTFASHLGMPEAVELLQMTLLEEAEADQKLSQLATQKVNVDALHSMTTRR